MDRQLERANRRMVEMLKRIGMFPYQEQPSPEEPGRKLPFSLDDLAVFCITAEIEFASLPFLPDVIEEVPDPIVLFHVPGNFDEGGPYTVASRGKMSELTDEMDFGEWVDGEFDDYVPLFSEQLAYDDDADVSLHCLGCKSIRNFFSEIGKDSPEKHLERTRGALMGMSVKTLVQ